MTLGPAGSGLDRCEIAFTVDVLKVPTIDARPAIPGVQTFTPAYAEGILVVPGNPNCAESTATVATRPGSTHNP